MCQKTHNQTGCDGYIPIKGVPGFLVMGKMWLFNIHIFLVYSSTTIFTLEESAMPFFAA